jgi:hypothetical protein
LYEPKPNENIETVIDNVSEIIIDDVRARDRMGVGVGVSHLVHRRDFHTPEDGGGHNDCYYLELTKEQFDRIRAMLEHGEPPFDL